MLQVHAAACTFNILTPPSDLTLRNLILYLELYQQAVVPCLDKRLLPQEQPGKELFH